MKNKIAFLLGPLSFFLLWWLDPIGQGPQAGQVLGVVLWMLIWWISETVPMAVTSLLPIVLFPLFGILKIEEATAPYGDKFVFLFLGGFVIALAMEKWNLHRRLALGIVNLTGTGANRIVFGFMLASFLISMWISNTATTLMMFPIAMSVVTLLMGDSHHEHKGKTNFATSIMLCIAYGSNIGGVATLVGSPPNAAMAGILSENHQYTVTFFDWFLYGFPFAVVLMLLAYVLMVKFIFPNRLGTFELGKEVIQAEIQLLGPWKSAEKKIFIVFGSVALLWIFLEFISGLIQPLVITDVGVAIIGALILFMIPSEKKSSKPILEWKDTEKLPWGVLLMFGGGLSLARGFKESGLIEYVTAMMNQMDRSNLVLFVSILCFVGLILTVLMSNLAMVNIFVPVVAALAIAGGQSPEQFAIPVTIAASCDFMFPMSTPPNAIAYSSGFVKSKDMFKAGLALNLLSYILLTIMVYFVL